MNPFNLLHTPSYFAYDAEIKETPLVQKWIPTFDNGNFGQTAGNEFGTCVLAKSVNVKYCYNNETQGFWAYAIGKSGNYIGIYEQNDGSFFGNSNSILHTSGNSFSMDAAGNMIYGNSGGMNGTGTIRGTDLFTTVRFDIAVTGSTGHGFGKSVALTDTSNRHFLSVGSPFFGRNCNGSVRLFVTGYNATTGFSFCESTIQTGSPATIGLTGNSGDYFGHSIAITKYPYNFNADLVSAIASPGNSVSGLNAGKVSIYRNTLSSPYLSSFYTLLQEIYGPFPGTSTGLCINLCFYTQHSGTALIIGWPNASNNRGAVQVWHRTGCTNYVGTFCQMGQTLSGEREGDRFGESISYRMLHSGAGFTDPYYESIYDTAAFTRSVLVVGAPNACSGLGSVSTFSFMQKKPESLKTQTQWNKYSCDLIGKNTGDYFGYSVAISCNGACLFVGAPKNNLYGNCAGGVYGYDFSKELMFKNPLFCFSPTVGGTVYGLCLHENNKQGLFVQSTASSHAIGGAMLRSHNLFTTDGTTIKTQFNCTTRFVTSPDQKFIIGAERLAGCYFCITKNCGATWSPVITGYFSEFETGGFLRMSASEAVDENFSSISRDGQIQVITKYYCADSNPPRSGLAMISRDSGANWYYITGLTATGCSYSGYQYIGGVNVPVICYMEPIVISGIGNFVCTCVSPNGQVIIINQTQNCYNFYQHNMFISTDTGYSWSLSNTPDKEFICSQKGYATRCIQFVNTNEDASVILARMNNSFYKSTDTGISWNMLNSYPNTLNGTCFLCFLASRDLKYQVILTFRSNICVSCDFGNTWYSITELSPVQRWNASQHPRISISNSGHLAFGQGRNIYSYIF